MKKSNFSFKDIKGILTRDEMRQIKGGSGSVQCGTLGACKTNSDCSIGCSNCVAPPSGSIGLWSTCQA